MQRIEPPGCRQVLASLQLLLAFLQLLLLLHQLRAERAYKPSVLFRTLPRLRAPRVRLPSALSSPLFLWLLRLHVLHASLSRRLLA